MKLCRTGIIGFVFMIAPLMLGAADWSEWNLKALSSTNENARTMTVFEGEGGRQFTLSYESEPGAAVMKKVVELRDLVYSWSELQLRSLTIIVAGDSVEAIAIPEKLVLAGTDVAVHLPAGLGFYYRDYIQFDFRMVKDSISMRIAGRYIDRAGLATLMQRAIENPLTFADKTNYMARLDRLDRELEELTARHGKLVREHELLRHGTLYLLNTGFLCGPSDIPLKSVKRAVALKSANPKYDVDRIRDELKKEGIKLSGGEVEMIFAVYFNEWEP